MVQLKGMDFVRGQFAKLSLEPADLAGRTVVVTGANAGLGFEAAKYLAGMQPERLVLVCRSMSKGEEAISGRCSYLSQDHSVMSPWPDIKAATGFTAETLPMDMSDFASISAFATAFEEKYDRLDILLCNAGVHPFHYEATKDGWEST